MTMDGKLDSVATPIGINDHVSLSAFSDIAELIYQFVIPTAVRGNVKRAEGILDILFTELEKKTRFRSCDRGAKPSEAQLRRDLTHNPELIEDCAILEKKIGDYLAQANPPEYLAALNYYQDALTKLNHPSFINTPRIMQLMAELARNKANCHWALAKESDKPEEHLIEAEHAFEEALAAYTHCDAKSETREMLQLMIISIRSELIGLQGHASCHAYLSIINMIKSCHDEFVGSNVIAPHYLQLIHRTFNTLFKLNAHTETYTKTNTEKPSDHPCVTRFIRFCNYSILLGQLSLHISNSDIVKHYFEYHTTQLNTLLREYQQQGKTREAAAIVDTLHDYVDSLKTNDRAFIESLHAALPIIDKQLSSGTITKQKSPSLSAATFLQRTPDAPSLDEGENQHDKNTAEPSETSESRTDKLAHLVGLLPDFDVLAKKIGKRNAPIDEHLLSMSNKKSAPEKSAKPKTASPKTKRLPRFADSAQTFANSQDKLYASPTNLLRNKMLAHKSEEFLNFIQVSYLLNRAHADLFKHMTQVFDGASTHKNFNLSAVSHYLHYLFLPNKDVPLKVGKHHYDLGLNLVDHFSDELDAPLRDAIAAYTAKHPRSERTIPVASPIAMPIEDTQDESVSHIKAPSQKTSTSRMKQTVSTKSSRRIEDEATGTHADKYIHGISKSCAQKLSKLDPITRTDYAKHLLFNYTTAKAHEAAFIILEQGIESGDPTFPKLICEMRIRLADMALASVNKTLSGKRPLSPDDETRAHADYQQAQAHLNVAIDTKDQLMQEVEQSSWLYKVSVQIVFLRKINKKLTGEMRSIHVSPTNFMTSPAPANEVWKWIYAKEAHEPTDPKKINPYKGAISSVIRRRRHDQDEEMNDHKIRNWLLAKFRA